jgi:hypothetical protein
VISVLAGCAPGGDAFLAPPPEDQGFQLAMDVDSPPGGEIWKCQIGPLQTQDTQAVHRVQHVQSAVVHHMDVIVLLYSGAQNLAPGMYDCADLYGAYPKLMEETILYAAQNPAREITLPDGIAAQEPPGITLMYELHHVNATSKPVHLSSRVNAWTMPPGQPITGTLGGFVLRNKHMDIPPHAEKTEWAQCVMDQDVDVLFLSSHTHKLGRDVQILKYGGADEGRLLFENTDWQQPLLQDETPPLHLAKGEGIDLRCNYLNDTDETVNWGFLAKDEMCNGVLVFTPGNGAKCTMVHSSSGILDNGDF